MLCDPIESSDQGRLIAERVATAVAHPVDLAPVAPDAPAVAVRASIGVAFLAPGDDAAALLGRADAAMYRAKRRGPGSVELAGGDEQVAAAPRSR